MPKRTQEKIDNLNSRLSIKETEFVVKYLPEFPGNLQAQMPLLENST